jgi:uncharacterized damage-inducible protein DinB
MLKLFEYNWQVRDDWFAWCQDVPEEQLLRKRTGGIGGILHTLFHVVEVEYSWIVCDMEGKPDFHETFGEDATLQNVQALSNRFHEEVKSFVSSWNSDMESRVLNTINSKGEPETFKYGEIMRHVIAHEIHHIGQLSVWSRELGKVPITSNLIRRGLF